jgi:uncharacterized protein (DUF488 family)
VDLLRKFDVQRVVDVRSSPYSRYSPQFNRESLMSDLQYAGIAYGYAGEYLGGRPADPTCYFAKRVPEGRADYLRLVDYAEVARRSWFVRGLDRLVDRAGAGVTVVLCSEEDPARCHRHHLLARELDKRNIEVLHLRAGEPPEPFSTTDDRIAREKETPQLGLFDVPEEE